MTLRSAVCSVVALVFAATLPSNLVAQNAPPAPAMPTPVHLKIVVDRTEGDKPAVSIPFELVVRANTNSITTLNHGRSVPVQQTTFMPMASGGVPTMPQVST